MSRILNIEVANTGSQTLLTDGVLNLGTIVRKYCCPSQNGTPTFQYTNGSTALTLNQSGYYLVQVNVNVAGSTTGDVTLTLNNNGTAIPFATATETIGTATTEIHNLSFSTIVRVLPNSPITLTLTNTGVGAIYSLTDVDVAKII